MAEEVLDRIIELTADVLDVPVDEITAKSSPETIKKWDSIQHLNLVLAFEEHFQLKFLPEEIWQMLTIDQIYQLIKGKMT